MDGTPWSPPAVYERGLEGISDFEFDNTTNFL